ncbi:MAG: hypothetical protein FWF52_02415 [Candidatus Azobacteroides sp.]|nr:hypothetical protein [Candidatus Azobacteroides sp.]
MKNIFTDLFFDELKGLSRKDRIIAVYFILSFFLIFFIAETPIGIPLALLNLCNAVRLINKVKLQ